MVLRTPTEVDEERMLCNNSQEAICVNVSTGKVTYLGSNTYNVATGDRNGQLVFIHNDHYCVAAEDEYNANYSDCVKVGYVFKRFDNGKYAYLTRIKYNNFMPLYNFVTSDDNGYANTARITEELATEITHKILCSNRYIPSKSELNVLSGKVHSFFLADGNWRDSKYSSSTLINTSSNSDTNNRVWSFELHENTTSIDWIESSVDAGETAIAEIKTLYTVVG